MNIQRKKERKKERKIFGLWRKEVKVKKEETEVNCDKE